jgi:hypothetical protein
MTDQEVETVAEELAKVGGVSWYPGREHGPVVKIVCDRYRDRARVAIAALERLRAGVGGAASVSASSHADVHGDRTPASYGQLQLGSVVIYRAPGDRRAYACQVVRIEANRAYLVPCPRPDVGWVEIDGPIVPMSEDLPPAREQRT